MTRTTQLAAILALAALLSACNLPGSGGATPTKSPENVMTAAAETVAVQLTADAANRPTSTSTPEPSATPSASPTAGTPASSATARPPTGGNTGGNTGCDAAAFVADVTVDDGTKMNPGQAFTKTWRLRNAGTCTWSASYELVFVSGDRMGGPSSQKLTASVAPGQEVDISVNLVAPNTPAKYTGNWMLRNASGVNFGVEGGSAFWVIIEVTGGGTATITNTPGGPTATTGPSATSSPSLYSSASSLSVGEIARADLDLGNVSPTGGGYDFEFSVSGSNKSLSPINGATFSVWGATAPTLNNCATATLSASAITVNSGLVGQYLCYRTNDGRYGFLKVLDLTPADAGSVQTLEISYSTYATP
ncbi:MAG: hypothetical protein HYZ26_00700 [Chloroflexi bacterium]|nr:hypothetical protein [Chloroflexota bacterium]